ncbi:MAG TPA: rod shape-determining protein RodA [Bacteroidales bacterium]|mgnify:CR=1 FL=1|jgi:rod shape determining protein RodA|nr:rod shape-determining protein RodA [Bacteroidales bacterium]HPS70773.1 rod shape-determining protein RodA [Bacteroidales bacterium]
MFIENRSRSSKGVDVQLIVYYLLLVAIGWLTIYSSAANQITNSSFFSFQNVYTKQLLFIGTSFAIAFVILLIDSRLYVHYAMYIYFITLLLMILVLFIGTDINGAHAWIKIGSFSIQPTEFAKFATALAIAKFFNEGKTTSEKKYLWLNAFLFILVPIVIILLQKDTGSALVFLSFIILFYREGLTGWILLLGTIAVGISLFTLFFNEIYAVALLTTIFLAFWYFQRKDRKKIIRNVVLFVCSIIFVFGVNLAYQYILQDHQRTRIDTLIGKVADPLGADFNVNQSKIAIGSGGFWGKGYLNGTQTKLNYVPEQSTDFIFCGVGEEWGFIGSFALCSLFIALIIRIIILSEKNRNQFVRCYGYGIAGIIFMHFFINIGMTIGLLPIIGIPLPFISYGGSSLWAFTIMLFIFIKLSNN